ncbi:MAG: hypothetical protein HQ518_15690 [Rhodopirellula sp.]|nr:hypothetical protein [Rhodopirellula sp.]
MKLGLDADQIIEITVRDLDSHDTTSGTGYPITPGRVITAAHVLFDEETGESLYANCEISLRFHGDQYSDHDPVIAKPEWNGFKESGDGRRDAAVLSCDLPRGVTCHHSLPDSALKDGGEWHSRGHSEASEETGQPDSVRGDFPECSSGDKSLIITTRTEYHDWEKWHGISGGPVFRTDRGCERHGLPIFAGVITEYKEGQTPDAFVAVPMWKLLQDERFRKAISFSEIVLASDQLDAVIRDVEKLLSRLNDSNNDSNNGLKAFRTRFGDAFRLPEEPNDCARALIGIPADQLTDALRVVFKSFAAERTMAELEIVEEIQDRLLPFRCFPDLREQVRQRLAPGRGVLIEGLIGHMSIAELLMAGVDGRRAAFEIRDVNAGPIGKDAFFVPDAMLPGGTTNKALQFAIDLVNHMIDSMTESMRIVVRMRELNKARLKSFPEKKPGTPDYVAQLSHLAKVFDKELAGVSEHNGGRKYYAVFEYPFGDDDETLGKRELLRSAIKSILNEMKHLTFLELIEEPDEREDAFEKCIRFRHADRKNRKTGHDGVS